MDADVIAANLAAIEAHFGSEDAERAHSIKFTVGLPTAVRPES